MDVHEAAALTDVGRHRRRNEDSYAVGETAWVVADGLGGHPSGDVAARHASAAVVRAAEEATARGETALDAVRHAVLAAHEDILAAAIDSPDLHGMASTVVAAVRDPQGRLAIGHVGDSRAYLLVGDDLAALTTDHNEAAELLGAGLITAEQARHHPGQTMLTQCLGLAGSPPRPATTEVTRPGRLLLCTDGLTSEVADEDIAALLRAGSPEDACSRLTQAALEHGGHDNVTVLVLDVS